MQAGNATQGMQMAEAIGKTGVVLGNLREKYIEISDTRNLIEAENVMRAKTQEFNNWRSDPANADESKWLTKWQEVQGETQKHIDGLEMTEGARLNLTRSFGRWSDGQTISVQGDAFKQGVKRTGAALQLRAQQAEEAGDDGQVSSTYDQAAKLNVMTPEEAELAKYNSLKRSKATRVGKFDAMLDADMSAPSVEWDAIRETVRNNPDLTDSEKKIKLANIDSTHVRRSEMDDIQAATLTNPAEARKRLQSGEWSHIPDGDRQAAIVRTKEIQAAGANDAFRKTLTQIELGQVKLDETFDSPETQDLTPIMRDILKVKNEEFHSKEKKAIRVALQNSPAIYENAVGVIAKYDPAKDEGGLQKAQIGAALELDFSGTHLEELKKRLDERGSTQPGQIDANPALAWLQNMVEAGGLGDYKVPLTIDGAPVMSEPKKIGTATATGQTFLGIDWLNPDDSKDVMTKPKPVTSIDPMKQAQAAAKQATIRKALESEVKANKWKTNDEVLNRAIQLYHQHGGKTPADVPQPTEGFEYLVPGQAGYDAAKADMERAMKAFNYKPSK